MTTGTQILQALVEPSRRRLLDAVRDHEQSVGELVEVIGLSQPGVSRHLRILREAGLVRTRVAGTVHQNSLRRAELDARFPGLMEAIVKQIVNEPALSEPA